MAAFSLCYRIPFRIKSRFPPAPGGGKAFQRLRPRVGRIRPQAILAPELPAGWVVKSSGCAWMMTVLPATSSIEKRLVKNARNA